MPVTHFITHQIDKDPKAPRAIVNCSEKDEFQEDYATRVMVQLRNTFIGRASKRYGEFGSEVPHFKGLMLDWLNNKQTFTSLTQRLTKLFCETLDNTQLEVDGYLAFLAEQLADGDRFYVYHIREKSNVALNENKELIETRFIDFSNTGFALCLDTTLLQQPESKKYLSFSYGRGEKALQNAFLEFTGFKDSVNVEQETEEFLKIVEQYAQQLPDEEANETRSKIVDYCMEQDKYGSTVEFKALSSELDESSPDKFENFIKEKRIEIRSQNPEQQDTIVEDKKEFIPDRKSLRNYVRFSGKNKDVTLSFSAMALGNDIQFDATKETLIISNLPARLLKQLKQES
ncbi:nucleoid-associated protein YejK [Oceaniserpentilla sp. 4NH20-0058]|uniref:nucleoid-associated protein n=1 Tax=Oceaniserpentilla sp. 4NH20-0058 TaxID=3127660 RepID=UPI003106CADD